MRPLKLSILDHSPAAAGASHRTALAQTVELAMAADRLGYTRFWVSEHHNSMELVGSAPEVLIAAAAARTSGRLRVGSAGVLLSHYSALKVAEQFRVLEALYPGRIDLGVGRAPGGSARTAEALRDGRADEPERYPQQVAELVQFLHDTVPAGHRHEGVRAMPLVESAPQLWVLGSSGISARLAARMGAAFGYAQFLSSEDGAQTVHAYRREFLPSALGAVPQCCTAVFVICDETDEAAARTAGSGTLPLSTPQRERMIAGGPETVRRELFALGSRWGIDEVVVVPAATAYKDRLRTCVLLAEAFGLPG
ncbi:LLM class flavin-dependent oxidoreductase [Paenibacillus chartarius]|uniref:LLM class flavin-dependent oxidoreductase n=1 Tax=Paenibacillus chartarius TaxID=747481 RepID=A0ABV6DGA8_9BACL